MKLNNKKGKCKICQSYYLKFNISHVVCSPSCAIQFALKKKKQRETKELKIKKESLKTISDYIKETQIAFNAYIRERDKEKLCICCDKPLTRSSIGGSYDCGHYRSVGSAPHLRFDERNAHAQRKQCNRYGAGRAVDYRIGLIKRIGIEEVEKLESEHGIKKWSKEELIQLKNDFCKKRKELKRLSNL